MEIPDAAYAAGHKADPYALSSDVIRAAAPLIVAAELRRLLTEFSPHRFSHAIILKALLERANELDQQQ